jgi:hypothetical protein
MSLPHDIVQGFSGMHDPSYITSEAVFQSQVLSVMSVIQLAQLMLRMIKQQS